MCENLDFEDALVDKLGFMSNLEKLYNASKLAIVPIFEGTGTAIKLHEARQPGRPSSAHLSDSVGSIHRQGLGLCGHERTAQQTAEIILDLLTDNQERKAMQRRAMDLMTQTPQP